MTNFPAIKLLSPGASVWDKFCSEHEHGHLLQTSRWGLLKQQTSWHTHRLIISDDERIRAGAQILVQKRFGLAMCYVPRGPLFSDDLMINHALVAAINRYASEQNAIAVRYEPFVPHDHQRTALFEKALTNTEHSVSKTIQPQHTVITQLTDAESHKELTDQQLLASLSKGHRADIKKAERAGVTIRYGTGANDIATFSQLMKETGARANFDVHPQTYYQTIWDLFGTIDHGTLILADYNDQTIAGALIVGGANTVNYLYGGSRAEAFQHGANHLIQWSALQWARDHGYAQYDFWGIPYRKDEAPADGEQPSMAGLIRFKKGFGGDEVSFMPAYTHILKPTLYNLVKTRFSI
jgi:lipid II:glycine glycyltransferase (peptidoglycan interpeptide bridge formation enzyme)